MTERIEISYSYPYSPGGGRMGCFSVYSADGDSALFADFAIVRYPNDKAAEEAAWTWALAAADLRPAFVMYGERSCISPEWRAKGLRHAADPTVTL